MVNKSVNLLQPEEASAVEKKRLLLIKTGTIGLIVVYCLFLAAVFSFWLVTQQEAKAVTKKIKAKETRLVVLQEIEALQLLLKQRLSSLSEVVEVEKKSLKYQFGYLESLVPNGVELKEIQWDSDGGVRISGIASNALTISDYLDHLKEAADKRKIARSTLISATRQQEGVYSFNLEILLKE